MLKLVVVILELAYIIGASILVGQDYISKFLYFSVGFFIVALMGYAISGYTLFTLLSDAVRKQTIRANTHMMDVARRIKLTAIANAFLILCNLVCVIGLGETNTIFKELGDFTAAGFHNAQIAVMTAQLCVITQYLFLSFTSRGKKNMPETPNTSKKEVGEKSPAAYKSDVQPVNNNHPVVIDHYNDPPLENDGDENQLEGPNGSKRLGTSHDRVNVMVEPSLRYMSPPSSYSLSSPDEHGPSAMRIRKVLVTQHQEEDDDDLLAGGMTYRTPRSEPNFLDDESEPKARVGFKPDNSENGGTPSTQKKKPDIRMNELAYT
jgi:hypothetical protein